MPVNGSPQSVAEWMLGEVERSGQLFASAAAEEVARLHGPPLVRYDDEGLPVLAKPVIDAFRDISGDGIVWEMSRQLWRRRRPGDRAGREQR